MEHLLLLMVFLFVTKLKKVKEKKTGSFNIVSKHKEEQLPFALLKIRDKTCTIHLAWDPDDIRTLQFCNRIIHDNKLCPLLHWELLQM